VKFLHNPENELIVLHVPEMDMKGKGLFCKTFYIARLTWLTKYYY